MNANIILVGMPASGKSTIGALLAEKLNYIFIDTDTVIPVHPCLFGRGDLYRLKRPLGTKLCPASGA